MQQNLFPTYFGLVVQLKWEGLKSPLNSKFVFQKENRGTAWKD